MSNGKMKPAGGGGQDMVMESRHLLGLFLGVVVLCGVFFTLGYVMGRTQHESSVRAASASSPANPAAPLPAAAPAAAEKSPALPGPAEWDFYRSSGAKKAENSLKSSESRPAGAGPESRPAASVKPGSRSSGGAKQPSKPLSKARYKAPLIPRGAIVLQLAALTREGDALALAEALQQKQYPAYVLTPAGDNLYRVQVGPYADSQSAELARRALLREGFKAIVKR